MVESNGKRRETEYGSISVPDRQGLLNTDQAANNKNENDVAPAQVLSPWKLAAAITAILTIIFLVAMDYPHDSDDDHANDMKVLEQTLNAAEPLFYLDQLVDHHDPATSTYAQRYYEKRTYFAGPGSPIFLILGGEDELEGLLYPWIHEHLAQHYHAMTYALEHRFFGESWPVPQHRVTNHDLAQLLIPNQALWDAVRFIQHKRMELSCSLDRQDVTYCPVMTVGGSYPGFLSALMRFVHADVVDISYAASAPLNLYSHHVDVYAYYDKITAEAERASPGCSGAVRTVLHTINDDLYHSTPHFDADTLAVKYGMCPGSIPQYIQDGKTLADELMFVVATHFAEFNMMYYPPGPTQDLVKACHVFQQHGHRRHVAPESVMAAFLAMGNDEGAKCYDLAGKELPDGPNATITGSDWSGIGSGDASIFWEFLSCQLLSPTGFSESSMFPAREWSFAWERTHCYNRFEWNIAPNALEDEFHFDERANVTHLLLTNGLVDGWSLSSILQSDSPGVTIVNMVNGAHHSDLDHHGPTPQDTPDVQAAFDQIRNIIGLWLDEIRAGTAPHRV